METIAISFYSILFLVPFILLPISFIFELSKIMVILAISQVLLIFTIKIIISIRFKERILDIFLTPVSLCFIIAIALNSYVQARFKKGVYWKGRIYNVNTPEKISLVSDNYYEQQVSE
jgi:hypothetical protein